MDRAGDGGGITAGLGAVAVQQRAALGGVGGVAAWDVPHVCVLSGHAEHGGGASGDEDRRVRVLERFWVAECAREVDVGAMEVERLGLRPQPPDDRASFREGLHGLTKVVVGQAMCLVLAAGRRGGGGGGRPAPGGEPAGGWGVSPRQYRSRVDRRRRYRRSWRSWPASQAAGTCCW